MPHQACWTISNITAGTREQIHSVIEANIIPPLVHLLATAEFDIKKEAAWSISNATSGGAPEQIKYLVQQGCIKPLCDLLTCNDPRLVTVALEGIENVLKAGEHEAPANGGTNPYTAFVDEAEGLDKLEQLQSHSNEDVYKKAMHILETYFGLDVRAPPGCPAAPTAAAAAPDCRTCRPRLPLPLRRWLVVSIRPRVEPSPARSRPLLGLSLPPHSPPHRTRRMMRALLRRRPTRASSSSSRSSRHPPVASHSADPARWLPPLSYRARTNPLAPLGTPLALAAPLAPLGTPLAPSPHTLTLALPSGPLAHLHHTHHTTHTPHTHTPRTTPHTHTTHHSTPHSTLID